MNERVKLLREEKNANSKLEVYALTSSYDANGLLPQGVDLIKIQYTNGAPTRIDYSRRPVNAKRNKVNELEATISMGSETEQIWVDRVVKFAKKGSEPILVKVKEVGDKEAYCLARYGGRWLLISLDSNSLKQQGLKQHDTFSWIPTKDGVVNQQDICLHPGHIRERQSNEVMKYTQELFDHMREIMGQKESGVQSH